MSEKLAEIPVGRPVRYWPGGRIGEGKITRTTSETWMLGGHTPVVRLEGVSGCIALSHVELADVYPCAIGVFCDRCGTVARGDYWVHDGMDQQERFQVARRHLAENEDWSCTPDADLCTDCVQGVAA